jgi:hypothetical protein
MSLIYLVGGGGDTYLLDNTRQGGVFGLYTRTTTSVCDIRVDILELKDEKEEDVNRAPSITSHVMSSASTWNTCVGVQRRGAC